MIRYYANLSLQTKLIILTHLELVIAVLNWKPSELDERLNRAHDVEFNGFSLYTTLVIKSLINATIVVEYFCSLVLPFECILKLYPVITWSRPNNLLPWLVTYIIYSIYPKIFSIVIAFAFYFKSVIPFLKLMEFFIVESINLSVASYNWLIFYAFYLDLRSIEKHRLQRDSQMSDTLDSFSSPLRNFSSIPNIHEILRDSFTSLQSRALRPVHSLTNLEGYSIDSLDSELSIVEEFTDMTPAEKTMKLLKLTDEDVEDARKHKSDIFEDALDADSLEVLGSSGSEEDSSDYTICSCYTTSEASSIFKRPDSSRSSFDVARANFFEPASSLRTGAKAKRINHSNHRLKDASRVNLLLSSNDSGLQFRLNANFKLFDLKHHSHSHMKKWLLFRNQLQSSLEDSVFLKETSSILQKVDKVTKDQQTQTRNTRRPKTTRRRRLADIKKTKEEILGISKQTFVSYHVTRNANFSLSMPTKKSSLFYPIKYRRSNISVLKSMKPTEWSKYLEDKREQELRNLKAYNRLTLEQDRREILQMNPGKKKRPKPYKKVPTIQARNSEPTHQMDLVKSHPRSCFRDRIDRLDWSTTSNYSLDYRGPKSEPSRRVPEEPDRHVIVDDETLNQLQNAFSFSDETERGFQLGPELNEPYPVFQFFALTMAEIFKASGWRNLTTEVEVSPMTTVDVIFCESEVQVEMEDATEKRMIVSVKLLQQLQELMESSKEALQALENSRMAVINESRLKFIDLTDEFLTKCTMDYLDAFRELTMVSDRISRELKILMGDDEPKDDVRMIYENKTNFNSSKTVVTSLDALPPSTSADFQVHKDDSDDDLVELFNGFYKNLSARLGNRDKLRDLARNESFLNFISLFDKDDLGFLCKRFCGAKPPCDKNRTMNEVLITEIELHSSEFHDDLDESDKKSVVTSTNQCLPSTSQNVNFLN